MNLTRIFPAFILVALILGCESDNSEPIDPKEETNLEEAMLTDFPLKEIEYLDINITQPKIENNEALNEGEIIITLPHTVTSPLLTLKSVNIDLDRFNVFPSVGIQELFSTTDFTKYTITSKSDVEKEIHYNVKIVIAPTPEEERLFISSFELLANDNSAFTDINLIKEARPSLRADSLLICLFSKTVDFSDITPAIKYNGSKIQYRVNDEDFEDYPIETGKSIDFKYPNTVDFKISNAMDSKSVTYRIMVDTQHPISFTVQELLIPDLNLGDTYTGAGVATWTNAGNYPISAMSPNEYTNVITPATGLDNILMATLSVSEGRNVDPGESGTINVVITNTPQVGQYEAIALFDLNFDENLWRIVNSPMDDFISDFDYRDSELLKLKVTIID